MSRHSVSTAVLASLALALGGAQAQSQSHAQAQLRTLELDGAPVQYQLRVLEPQPLASPEEKILPLDSPVNTARLIARHLAAGDIEEAALLSNSPKRRFEVLTDYREAVGEAAFKDVYAQYFDPRNPLVAEIAIGPHRVLAWRLGGRGNLTAQYYVEVDGRFLLDDVPSVERARLRRVFDAYRSGREALEPRNAP